MQGGNKLAHKLLQMGIVPGTYTRMIRKAPFGGPVLIEVDGMEIALSREIAAKVMVEER